MEQAGVCKVSYSARLTVHAQSWYFLIMMKMAMVRIIKRIPPEVEMGARGWEQLDAAGGSLVLPADQEAAHRPGSQMGFIVPWA